MELTLPNDLSRFLDGGQQFDYDPATCEAGMVTLHPRSHLQLRTFNAQCGGTEFENANPHLGVPGCYRVEGVDLVAGCTGDYSPEGLLVWFPAESSYGVWDSDHDYVFLFGPEVTWSQIAASPAKYINAQWAFDDLERASTKILVPWPRYPFGK